MHTLPGVRISFFPTDDSVVRFWGLPPDWSAKIPDGDWHRRRNLPLHPCALRNVQPALLRIAVPQRKPNYYTSNVLRIARKISTKT